MKLLGTSTSKCSFYPEAAGISGASSPRDEELTAGLPSVATVKNSPLIKERAYESLWKRLFPWATYPPGWHERPIICYSSRTVSNAYPLSWTACWLPSISTPAPMKSNLFRDPSSLHSLLAHHLLSTYQL